MLRRVGYLRSVLLQFIKTGRANRNPMSGPSRALIVQMAKLGDMICTTPMFHAIKEWHPGCQVDVLGQGSYVDLLRHDPSVDTYLTYSDDHQALREQIRANAYDFACCTSPNDMGAYLLYTAGVPLITLPMIRGGASPYESALYRFVRRFCRAVPHEMMGLTVEQYLRLLEPIGIRNASPRKRVYPSPCSVGRARAFLSDSGIEPATKGIIGISPSAGNKLKLWGGEKFAALAERLAQEDGRPVVVIGSSSDKAEVDEMWRNFSSGVKIANATEQFDLDGLIGLITHFDVFVSADTGPIYIADALGVGTVNIIGPCQPQRPMNSGRNVEVRVDELHCQPCSFPMDTQRNCRTGTHVCKRGVSVEMVLAAVRRTGRPGRPEGTLPNRT